jgi:hypothetical protein
MGKRNRLQWGNLKERDHFQHLDVGGTIILKGIIKKCVDMELNGFIWLRINASVGFAKTVRTFELHKMLGVF